MIPPRESPRIAGPAWIPLKFLTHQLQRGSVLQPPPDDVGDLAFNDPPYASRGRRVHDDISDLAPPCHLCDRPRCAACSRHLAIRISAQTLQVLDCPANDRELLISFAARRQETGIRQAEL